MQENWKTMEQENDSDNNYNWLARYSQDWRIWKNYGIVVIGQNSEKSPADLKRLAARQTPVEDYQLTLVWKTQKK